MKLTDLKGYAMYKIKRGSSDELKLACMDDRFYERKELDGLATLYNYNDPDYLYVVKNTVRYLHRVDKERNMEFFLATEHKEDFHPDYKEDNQATNFFNSNIDCFKGEAYFELDEIYGFDL